MSDDSPPNDLPSDKLPYGVDTIVIPFTWSSPGGVAEALANHVYANRNGDEASGDGYRYRGR